MACQGTHAPHSAEGLAAAGGRPTPSDKFHVYPDGTYRWDHVEREPEADMEAEGVKAGADGPNSPKIRVERGRWAVKIAENTEEEASAEVWLLQEGVSRVGVKYRVRRHPDFADALLLDAPEDFQYLGQSQYMYFQMTNPKSTILLLKDEKTERKK